MESDCLKKLNRFDDNTVFQFNLISQKIKQNKSHSLSVPDLM